VRYAFIERHKRIWPVADQCRVLEVAASGFRAWRKRQSGKPRAAPGKRVSDLALLTHIRAAFAASRQTYGWPRMVRQLRAEGLRVGKERVRKAMKSNDIRVRARRRFKATTDSRFAHRPEPVEPTVHDGEPQQGLGGRHHLCLDRRGLAVSGDRH
jgi:putative transposase